MPIASVPDRPRLLVEGRESPTAVATPRPRFGWRHARGVHRQTAYELEVFGPKVPIFRTGQVLSDQSVLVDVLTADLAPDTEYTWRVRFWTDDAEAPSPWLDSNFRTTLFWTSDWEGAHWVEPMQEPATAESDDWDFGDADAGSGAGAATPPEERLRPAQYLRQRIVLPAGVVDARLFASARGVYEALVNGSHASDEVLAPGYDSYQSRTSFQTFDVTALVQPGDNTLAVTLGDGWWAGRIAISGASVNYGDRLQAIWQLRVRLHDGTVLRYASDGSVQSKTGPIIYSDIFIGERYDGTRALPGEDVPGADGSGWAPVRDKGPATADLVPFIGDPVRRVREFSPREVYISRTGETIIDLGQNIAGRLRLRAVGPAGTTINLEHSETVTRDGNFLNNIMGRNKDQTDIFVLAGTGAVEEYEPTFTYHGFRYVRVTGYPGVLTVNDVTAVVLSSDTAQAGEFTTSDQRLNRLHENVVWSHRSNFFSIPTDCPQRERSGWTGDAQVFAAAATNNFDVREFYGRWLANVRAEQFDSGAVPVIVPYTPGFAKLLPPEAAASTGWADAIALVPWAMYQRYGDLRILAENYPAMLAWQRYAEQQAVHGRPEGASMSKDEEERQQFLFNTGDHLGDWLAPSTLEGADSTAAMMNAPRLTGAIMGSLFYAHTTQIVAQTARVLGHDSDAAELEKLFARIADAFVAEYVNDDGRIASDLQGVYVVALAFKVIPKDRRGQVVDRLVELIRANGTRLDTGFLSIPYLLDVLDDNGHTEVALELLWQDRQPSWLFEIDQGATTIWESWNAMSPEGDPQRVSFNHYAFGVVDDWLYRRIAGIAPALPGYKRSTIAPIFDRRLDRVEAHVDTPYGSLATRWERDENGIALVVDVPPNTTARVDLPEGTTSTGALELNPGRHELVVQLAAEPASAIA